MNFDTPASTYSATRARIVSASPIANACVASRPVRLA
jgi:hypothetical protein